MVIIYGKIEYCKRKRLAKKIIDTHGGEIIFKSTEGKGSLFGFKLPLVA